MKQQNWKQTLFALGTILPFCAILLFFAFSSLNIIGDPDTFSDSKTVIENIQSLEGQIKEDAPCKTGLVETYGLLHEALALNIIGDMEFIRDDAGLIQRVEPAADTTAFTASMLRLHNTLQKTETPLIFMTLPDRGLLFDAADGFSYSGQVYTEMVDRFSQAGIDILDVYDATERTENAPQVTDFFFRTDIHLTTQAEFFLASTLTEHLSHTYQVEFPATELVYDEAQYQWVDYTFWGNFGRTAGKNFTGTDTFTTFTPLFETDLRLEDLSTYGKRTGSFEQVMTNGFSDPSGDSNLYWVTNYGQYPSPCYRYENRRYPEGPDLLIISDSMSMRMNTFLTLNAGSVTVLDSRFFSDTEYVARCLAERRYDAVIVCGSSLMFYSSAFETELEIVQTVHGSQKTGYYGMYLDRINNVDQKVPGEIDRALLESEDTITLVGWAIDHEAGAPLSALYLQIGDSILICNYGLPRTSVSDYFQDENLLMSGFEITFPAEYLTDEVAQLTFIQVGADGTYRYEDVIYTINN